MDKLVLIRHGETEWNSDKRIQGSVDVPLSPRGIRQAEALAETLLGDGMSFGRAYASDLDRSRTTAQILAERLDVPVLVTSPLLRELHCGAWEGRFIEDLRTNESEAYEAWIHHPDFVIPAGESIMDLHHRVELFLDEQKAALDETENVLVVAHGLLNRMVLSVLLKLDPQQSRFFQQDNTAINVFSFWRDRIYCDAWNLTCHL
jgi:broad specificity phosphatase PhoE